MNEHRVIIQKALEVISDHSVKDRTIKRRIKLFNDVVVNGSFTKGPELQRMLQNILDRISYVEHKLKNRNFEFYNRIPTAGLNVPDEVFQDAKIQGEKLMMLRSGDPSDLLQDLHIVNKLLGFARMKLSSSKNETSAFRLLQEAMYFAEMIPVKEKIYANNVVREAIELESVDSKVVNL